MIIKSKLKRIARHYFLQSLRVASRPTLRDRTTPPDLSKPPKKLLVVRPDHLGDVLLTTPALRILRTALPDTEIVAMVGPWGAASLVGNPDVDKIIRCQFPGFSREHKENFLAPYLYALQQSRMLREQGFDAAISFRNDFWWGALLLFMADIPARFGFRWPESKTFLNFQLDPTKVTIDSKLSPFGLPSQHFTSLSLSLTQYLLETYKIPYAPDEADLCLKYYPSPEDKRYVNLNLSEWDINRYDKIVAVHPGTGATLKLWTAEKFAIVIDQLVENFGVKVVLTGSDKEAELIRTIAGLSHHPLLRWDTGNSWGRLAALFERCSLVLGLDSGPLHLAVAMGARTIHLFGPTDPEIFGPWGDQDKHHIIRTGLELPCQPCGVLDSARIEQQGGYCMDTIETGQVIELVAEMLS